MTRPPLWLLTIRPGPVLHVWRDGEIFVEIEMTRAMLVCLVRDAFDALWHKRADSVPNGTQAPSLASLVCKAGGLPPNPAPVSPRFEGISRGRKGPKT